MESAAVREIDSSTALPEPPPPRRPRIYFATALGLLISFFILWFQIPGLFSGLLERIGVSRSVSWFLSGELRKLIALALLFGVIVFLERRPLSSVGLKKPTLSDLGLGIALFTAVVLSMQVWGLLLAWIFPDGMAEVGLKGRTSLARLPLLALIAGFTINGFFEEVTARGFAIDRLRTITGSMAVAAVVAVLLNLAEHIPYWGWKYPIVIMPAQVLFALMYIWRKDISACIIAHILVDIFPKTAQLVWIVGLALYGSSPVHQTLASNDYYRGNYEGAIAEYTRALKQKPDDADLLEYRADAELKRHNYAAAISDYDSVLRRDPSDAAVLSDRGWAYFKAGNLEQALKDSDRAVALAPEDSRTYSYRAYIDFERKDYDLAVSDLSKAIKYSDEKDPDLYHRRGYVYLEKGDFDKAIKDLTTAGKLNPHDEWVFAQRARAYAHHGKMDLALADLSKALTIAPDADTIYVQRGTIYMKRGEAKLALADFEKAAKLDPDNIEAANDVAWLLGTSSDSGIRDGRRALELANRACAAGDWSGWNTIDTLAAAYAEAGDYTAAAIWQQRSIDLMKSSSAENQKEARERLELYRKGRPYRETKPWK